MASRYEKEDSKRRILSACVQLFIEKGYQKTTTVEILKKAGVTPSTFYNIYHTKGSILISIRFNDKGVENPIFLTDFNRAYRIYVWESI